MLALLYLMTKIPILVNVTNYNGDNVLHYACRYNKLDVVKMLLCDYDDMYDFRSCVVNDDGDTYLHLACMNNNLEMVKYLVSLNVFDTSVKNNYNYTPIHIAARNGFVDIVKYLYDDNDDSSILYEACKGGDIDTVKYLDERIKGCDVMKMHAACVSGRVDTFKYVFSSERSKYILPNGDTYLHRASENGCVLIVRHLLDMGANIDAKNYQGITPIHKACHQRHVLTVQYLVDRGADIRCKTANGQSLLDIASRNNDKSMINYLAAL